MPLVGNSLLLNVSVSFVCVTNHCNLKTAMHLFIILCVSSLGEAYLGRSADGPGSADLSCLLG